MRAMTLDKCEVMLVEWNTVARRRDDQEGTVVAAGLWSTDRCSASANTEASHGQH